jgi:hypothetical protein
MSRPDHERHQVVADADQDRHAHEEHHRGAVDREHLVEEVRPDEVGPRPEELRADQDRLDAADNQEDHRHQDVHDADLLVIGSGHPIVQKG